ncbi:DUF6578 domain-containing protein [Rhodococcus jostii]|nr:DUF6578 domain-containing protein [Rhodococcus jostii]
MVSSAERMRPHRTLRILVVALAIEDGQTPAPVVGSVGSFPLLFEETAADDSDPTIVTVHADAEPLGDGFPTLQPSPDADDDRRWEWSIFLRADGWSATWNSTRPAVGSVRVTGRVIGDLGYATAGSVRGRIRRVQVVSDMYREDRTRPRHWAAVPGTRQLRDVETSPSNFRDDVLSTSRRVPGQGHVREGGVLVDLDLDDVPPVPARPLLVPAAISAHADRLWVTDAQLPLVVRVDERSRVTDYTLPGKVFAAPNEMPRRVHADATGCWVAGWDGVYRCDEDAGMTRLSGRTVAGSTASAGTLLTCHRTAEGRTLLGLFRADGRHDDLEVPDGQLVAMGAGPDGFLVLLRAWRGLSVREGRLLRIGLDGSIMIGPDLEDLAAQAVLVMDPPRLFDCAGHVRRISSGLTLADPMRCPIDGFGGGTADDLLWIVHHDRERLLGDDRRYWLLSLFDARTLGPVASTPVHTSDPDVTVDGTGTVWITGHGVRTVPTRATEHVIRLDLARLLSGARSL